MGFIVIEFAVIAAHILAAFATGVFEHYLITAHRKEAARADPIMLVIEWH